MKSFAGYLEDAVHGGDESYSPPATDNDKVESFMDDLKFLTNEYGYILDKYNLTVDINGSSNIDFGVIVI